MMIIWNSPSLSTVVFSLSILKILFWHYHLREVARIQGESKHIH